MPVESCINAGRSRVAVPGVTGANSKSSAERKILSATANVMIGGVDVFATIAGHDGSTVILGMSGAPHIVALQVGSWLLITGFLILQLVMSVGIYGKVCSELTVGAAPAAFLATKSGS